MENIHLQTLKGMWFQHDGAPAYCADVIRDYSNKKFSQRWIGRKTNIFSLIAKFPQKLWICMKNCQTILMQNFMFFQNMQ